MTVAGGGRGREDVEFLLSLAVELDGRPRIFAIAGDTDGVDGADEIAGALVTPDSLEVGREVSASTPEPCSPTTTRTISSARSAIEVITGPTLTNVNDFRVVLINGP